MTVAVADPFMADVKPSGIQRGRGGFLRSADDAPYVSDPTGATVKTGERKGQAARLKYGSPSGAGRLVENDVGLTKYKQRLTLLGIGMDQALADACRDLVALETGSVEFRTAADAIAVAADNITRSWLAADRGSHGHLLCELFDLHGNWWMDDSIADGEALGLHRDTQEGVVAAWRGMLADNGLEILAIEASCVDDAWRLAGTLDRIVRTTRPLRFVRPDGQIVDIPAGTVMILDIKFGQVRRAHLIQIASYAHSHPYDTETETRGVWPWPIDQQHALIAHGDFGDDGHPPSIDLVWVDLAAGREHGGRCVADARDWNKRDDLWSVSQLDVPVESGISNDLEAATPAVASSTGTQDSPPASGLAAVTAVAGVSSAPVAAPSPVMADASWDVEYESKTTNPSLTHYRDTPDPARLALVDARNQLNATPDQGADLALGFDELWGRLEALFNGLTPPERAWRAALVRCAQRRGVPFHAQGSKTERTYHINRAVIALALASPDDDILRALLALVIGDTAFHAGLEPGHLTGSLTASQAERLAGFVNQYNQ